AMKLDFGTNNIHVISSSPTFRGIHSHGASINCIRSQNGNPEFYNALLTQDTSRPCESAFAASGGAPKIFGDIIVCSPAGENGVLVVDGANPEIQDLTILNPHDNGVYFQGLPRGLVTNCWIGRPGLRGINISDCYNINISRVAINQPVGTGIYTNRGTGSIHHCTIYRAGLGQSLDGIFIAGDNATWVVHSNIFSGCGGYGIRSTVANVTTSYCCFWQNGTDTHGGHAGSGSFDIFVNPELIIPTLELMDTSPCIDDGNPNTQYNDPDGTRGDMGAIFFDQNTPPEINTHSPQSLLLDGYAWGDVVEFSVTATDPDNDPLEYSWYYLGVLRSTTPEATITLVNNEILEDVTVTVYDGLTGYDSVRWDVRAVGVEDFSNTILPERFEISSIYPNPFNPSAQVTIAVDEPGLLVYTVYDLLGRELYSNKQNVIPGYTNFEIGGSDWGSGIYFLSVNLNESRETKKMVLIR
ncbi:MAG: right-handed parallel beta-helix repeat-containing protein, partial [Candidatus Electryonea clarkiae]|nr:right-handed parallel beta-helix repeat-containing protein [Candidatus Electryonea clarkiae]